MTDFSRILTSAPVNATAARQTSKGEHFKPRVQVLDYLDDPTPMRPVPPNKQDFTGVVVGRITVLGLSTIERRDGDPRWLCKCKCGRFALRRSKAIRKGTMPDRCGWCDYERRLRGQTLRGMRNDMGARP
jgi:hypothetical protein